MEMKPHKPQDAAESSWGKT